MGDSTSPQEPSIHDNPFSPPRVRRRRAGTAGSELRSSTC